MLNAFGYEIITSDFLVIDDPAGRTEEVGHRDWRERLARNFARPSTGRWEPLTFDRVIKVPDPNAYVLHDQHRMMMHPAHWHALKKLE